ncbi:NAD(P)-binding domain [Cordyceps militaris]|uniref:NAD(P)-binding domain n=1 Tax=Cordyceps militaris TaxID=73501 RepID=A0A2H4SBW6_CORMI|nr:NAD(P)-binding domain [Cordyceps militaris]
MPSTVQNVTLVGATGNVGAIALEKLAATKHNLQVLRREGSKSTFPASIKVIDVDFTSEPALTRALQGQDVVISTIPAEVAGLQTTLIDAAIAAGVGRFLPSEFGCNIENPKARQVPVFAEKVRIEDYLKQKAAAGLISYTFVFNGPLLEWGIENNFVINVAGFKPRLLDDGKAIFSSANLETVGRALAAIPDHLEATKNRAVFIEDIKISQERLLALAKQAAPEKPWEVTYAKTEDLVKVAGEGLAKGIFTFDNIAPFIHQAVVTPGYGGNFDKSDNELLGLGHSSEEFILEQYKKLLHHRHQLGIFNLFLYLVSPPTIYQDGSGHLTAPSTSHCAELLMPDFGRPTSHFSTAQPTNLINHYSCGCVKDSKFEQCEQRKDTPVKCDKITRSVPENLLSYCMSHCMPDKGRGLTKANFQTHKNGESGQVEFSILKDLSQG